MKNFLFKRILVMIPVFFGMTILVFLLSNLTPGSPVDAMITPEMTPADIEALYVRMGLDQPLYVQYIKWLGRLFQGSLGYSYRTGTEVIRVIGERVGPTLLLTGIALALSILIGVVLGVLAACKPIPCGITSLPVCLSLAQVSRLSFWHLSRSICSLSD